jgi:hypothetical protein
MAEKAAPNNGMHAQPEPEPEPEMQNKSICIFFGLWSPGIGALLAPRRSHSLIINRRFNIYDTVSLMHARSIGF